MEPAADEDPSALRENKPQQHVSYNPGNSKATHNARKRKVVPDRNEALKAYFTELSMFEKD